MLISEDWEKELMSEPICQLGKLKINKSSLFLLSGQTRSGKTASCIHFANSAVLNKKKVLYIDTEQKSILLRPEPNLLKNFFQNNAETFHSYFVYHNLNNFDGLIGLIKDTKPKLLIIDSIYQPFVDNYPLENPKTRAFRIKRFVSDLRKETKNMGTAIILTTQLGRIVNNGEEQWVTLGGEGLKYLSDVKVIIQFAAEDEDKDFNIQDKRIFIVDRQVSYAFKISYGGIITPL